MRASRIDSPQGGLERRGFVRYLEIAAREILSFTPHEYALTANGRDLRVRPLLIAIANGDSTATARSSRRTRNSTTASSISWSWTICRRGGC